MFNRRRLAVAAVGLLALATASRLEAQAGNYPAFQPPRVVSREFNFGIADAGRGGTTLVFQWREGMTPKSQFLIEAGLVAPDVGDNYLLLGGGWGYQLHASNSVLPLDFLLTAGAGAALGDVTALRIPFGVSVGHQFDLEGGAAITPYVHPRLSLDFCNDCGGDDVALGIDFDLGVSVDVTQNLALRGSAYFGGGDLFGRNGIGLAISWKSPQLR